MKNDAPATTESRSWRRLARSFVSADSYGFVLLLVIVTYVVSVSVAEARAASIVLTVQLATVWLTLRTSQARRVTRLVAAVVLCLAAIIAVVSYFVHAPGGRGEVVCLPAKRELPWMPSVAAGFLAPTSRC
jgi:hypothetical protein